MKKGRVLVVDDDPIALEIARARLVMAGYEVITRDLALGTSEEVFRQAPDVVLLDVKMPGMRGDHLGHFIVRRLRGTRVILHSGLEEELLGPLVSRSGVLGAIHKTSDTRAFLRAFEELMARMREGAEREEQDGPSSTA